jgi:hypothetical protein
MKTVTKIIEEQAHRWQLLNQDRAEETREGSVVTLSGSPLPDPP